MAEYRRDERLTPLIYSEKLPEMESDLYDAQLQDILRAIELKGSIGGTTITSPGSSYKEEYYLQNGKKYEE